MGVSVLKEHMHTHTHTRDHSLSYAITPQHITVVVQSHHLSLLHVISCVYILHIATDRGDVWEKDPRIACKQTRDKEICKALAIKDLLVLADRPPLMVRS